MDALALGGLTETGLLLADFVAKLFLQDGTQIFRAVGATIEQ
jgi:hypothetical protein